MQGSELTDNEIEYLQLIMKGYSSAYAVWSLLKQKVEKDASVKLISYKNVNKRFIKLYNEGILEEVNIKDNLHGRKDYKLTMKGLEQLIPYLLTHPNEVKNLVKYMETFGLDKNVFGISLINESAKATELLTLYQNNTSILFNENYWSKLISEKKLPKESKDIIDKFNNVQQDLIEQLYDSSPAQREYVDEVEWYQASKNKLIEDMSAKDLYDSLQDDLIRSSRTIKETELDIEKYTKILKKRGIIEDTSKTLDKSVLAANEAADLFMKTVDAMKKTVPEALGSVLIAGSSKKKKPA